MRRSTLDEEIDRLLNEKLMTYVLLAVGFWLLTAMEWYGKWMALPRQPTAFAIAALAFSGLLAFKVAEIRPKLRRIRQGRDGEREVAEILQGLVNAGARVIHDIPGDGFNVDHVVLSTHGIFVIETKTWSKRSAGDRIDFDGRQLMVSGKSPKARSDRPMPGLVGMAPQPAETDNRHRIRHPRCRCFPRMVGRASPRGSGLRRLGAQSQATSGLDCSGAGDS